MTTTARQLWPIRLFLSCLTLLLTLCTVAPVAAEPSLAIVGATVIDVAEGGDRAHDIADSVVLIEGGRIVAVGRRGEVKLPAGIEVVDGTGRFLVPGLVDGFAAINKQAYANAYLASGVTSIIAVSGGRRGVLFDDAEPGPHLHLLDAVGFERGTTAEHLAALDALAEAGNTIALLMYKLKPDQLAAVTVHAESLGMGTIGELGLSTYTQGIAAGIDAFVHTTRYSLALASAEMARGVAEEPFSDDLESPKWLYYRWLSELSPFDPGLARYAEELGASSVSLMPTLSLLYLDLPWATNPWHDPVARLLDPSSINNPADLETGRHVTNAAHQVAYSALARSEYLLDESYHRAGARYLAGSGTDVWGTMPGISLHQELEALVRIGHTPRQALAAATSNFAATFDHWGTVGQVAEGYQADLLLLRDDPRQTVKALRSIERVILAGRSLDPQALLRGPGSDGEVLSRTAIDSTPTGEEDGYLAEVEIEAITYRSDGLKVAGYLARPKAPGSYPCLIVNRGGNRAFGAWTDARARRFLARVASWGYVVAASQYRGNSGGEGQEEFGGRDVHDVLALIPLLEAEASADTSRLGIYGGSRGGLMTYLALARSDRFKAAVVRSGLTDLIAWQQERPEMAEVFEELIPGYDPQDDSTLLSRSPARWAERLPASTPILLLHGSADWRVPPSHALNMTAALIEAQRPARLILYEGGDHSLSEYRAERLLRTREWLDRYVRDGAQPPSLVPHGD